MEELVWWKQVIVVSALLVAYFCLSAIKLPGRKVWYEEIK